MARPQLVTQSFSAEPAQRPMPEVVTRMYAISFDFDTNALKEHYPGNSHTQAYSDIRTFLEKRGFAWQQGSVYFGDETINAVTCVLTTQAMSAQFPWLKTCVRDMRMLRIEDLNDLKRVL